MKATTWHQLGVVAGVHALPDGLVDTNERCGPSTRRVLTRDGLRAESCVPREETRAGGRP